MSRINHTHAHVTRFTGGPAAPEPSLHTISTSLLTLEWNKPFSWPEFPIEHYTLTSNHSLYYPSEIRINNAIYTVPRQYADREE